MKNVWRSRWPLVASLLVLWTIVAVLLAQSLARTDGRIVYILDDAYIHMAMAKHFARDGVWGVTPYAFSSSSSSPLWTALLALVFRLAGTREAAPLALNLAFASLALVVAHAWLAPRVPPFPRFVALAFAAALTPIPLLVFSGMEHTLQILLAIGFATLASDLLADGPPRRPLPVSLLALAALLPLARYEGLFAVAVAAAALVARGRRRDALALAACAVAPVAAYGLWSVAQGWWPIPNSVLLKGMPASPADWPWRIPSHAIRSKPLAALVGIAVASFVDDRLRGRRGWPADRVLLGLFVAVALVHFQFAGAGWFRYDAYLVVLGLVAVAGRLYAVGADRVPEPRATPRRTLAIVRAAVALTCVAFAWRWGIRHAEIPIGSQNIYQQQYQMGRFLARDYAGQAVAANDIGVINYLADLRCCDLIGLASMPIARLRLARRPWLAADVDRVVRDCDPRIAIVYESWFGEHPIRADRIAEDRIPERWGAPIGRWEIPDNVVCGDATVSFFALRPGESDTLAARLRAFSSRLPAQVRQSGRYLRSRF